LKAKLPAPGLEPRPSRVRGGYRNHSATQTDDTRTSDVLLISQRCQRYREILMTVEWKTTNSQQYSSSSSSSSSSPSFASSQQQQNRTMQVKQLGGIKRERESELVDSYEFSKAYSNTSPQHSSRLRQTLSVSTLSIKVIQLFKAALDVGIVLPLYYEIIRKASQTLALAYICQLKISGESQFLKRKIFCVTMNTFYIDVTPKIRKRGGERGFSLPPVQYQA
jgi:hypothetical protein